MPRRAVFARTLLLSLLLFSACSPTLNVSAPLELPVRQWSGDALTMLSWNVFMLPNPMGRFHNPSCRAKRIGERLSAHAPALDIVALNETYNRPHAQELLEATRGAFPYQMASLPQGRGGRMNGGVGLLSRYPIESHEVLEYDTCSGLMSDCRAVRGAIIAVVRLNEQTRVRVVATHLNAGGGGEGPHKARMAQLGQLGQRLEALNLARPMPTWILGDLNVNGIRWMPSSDAWQEAMSALSAQHTTAHPIDLWRHTHGPWNQSPQGTQQANTYLCGGVWLKGCQDLTAPERWRQRQRLDYAIQWSQWPGVQARADHLDFEADTCGAQYLSDHKAVRVTVDASF